MLRPRMPLLATALAGALLLGAASHVADAGVAGALPTQVRLVSIYPHNATAFTEGFFFLDGAIVESTGLAHQSFIRQYKLSHPAELEAVVVVNAADDDDGDDDDDDDDDDGSDAQDDDTKKTSSESRIPLTRRPTAPLAAGKVLKEFQFDADIFGEGVACIGDRIYALTYKRNKVLVLAKDDFRLLETHPFHTSTGEGWGMTTDGTLLIVSDGSASIQFYDPKQNFKRVRAIDVTDPATGEKIPQINELEFVEGEILANVWFKNVLLRIDPTDGRLIESLDLSWVPTMVPNVVAMQDVHMRGEAVMNGIAYNPKNRHVYITGKLWDSIFELELSYLKLHRRAPRS